MTSTQTPPPAVTARPGLLRRAMLSEPVRLYSYGVLIAVLGLLVYTGYMAADVAPLVAAIIAAVLAVPATESLRAKVWSQRSVTQAVLEAGQSTRTAP